MAHAFPPIGHRLETERETERDRQRDRETDRERDRQTDRQTDRQRRRTFYHYNALWHVYYRLLSPIVLN